MPILRHAIGVKRQVHVGKGPLAQNMFVVVVQAVVLVATSRSTQDAEDVQTDGSSVDVARGDDACDSCMVSATTVRRVSFVSERISSSRHSKFPVDWDFARKSDNLL
jgi:hypothetical protein